MTRIIALAWFLAADLSQSLVGIIPLALTAALYTVTFYYAGGLAYFLSVGGADLALVCAVSTMLLADRANRAMIYPLLVRLPYRGELLAAVVLGGLLITGGMALLITTLALIERKVTLTPLSAGLVIFHWLPVFAFVAVYSLHTSKLLSRGGSAIGAYLLLGITFAVRDRALTLQRLGQGWLVEAITTLTSPITRLLGTDAITLTLADRSWALSITAGYTLILFCLALWLFHRKDLLWAE